MARRTSPASKKRGELWPQPNAAQGWLPGVAHHCLLMIYRTIYRKGYRAQGGKEGAGGRGAGSGDEVNLIARLLRVAPAPLAAHNPERSAGAFGCTRAQ